MTPLCPNRITLIELLLRTHYTVGLPQIVCMGRVGQRIPKLMPTKSSEMVSSYDYLSQFNCIGQHLRVTAFYSKALLSYVVINSSCM